MIEVEEKYDFSRLIRDIEEYITKVEFNPDDIKKINRVLFKLRNIEAITNSIDEDLYSVLVDTHYNNLISYCNGFVSGQHNNLVNLQNVTNSILNDIIRYVDFNLLLGNKNEIKKNIRNYKYEITKQTNRIESETSELIKMINEKKNNLTEEESNINTLLKEFYDKLEGLDKKQSTLENNIETLTKQSKEETNKLIDSEKTKLQENFKELINDYVGKFDLLYTEIKIKDDQISKLLDIVGEKARIGEYKKNADSSKRERIIWQILTVLLFLASFCIMVYVIFVIQNYDKFTIFKYIVSGILMGASTYTAKQASNAKKDEGYYRKQELELASIDVYLENMSVEKRDEIKQELSLKMFGQAQNTYNYKYDDKKVFSTEDIIKIIEILKQGNSN